MNTDNDTVTEALARVREIAHEAEQAVDALMDGVRERVDAIREETLAATGVDIADTEPVGAATAMDAYLGDIAVTARACRHFLAAVELLGPLVEPGSTRTVGAVLKTSVDPRKGERILDHLTRSGIYEAEEEGACDG
ncbi:hypothetical protein O3Q52_47840 [Streptomyces sp. ActVer]|uniref:hypothetical protein n=1 Tax=Streptomyces sp. ActVer TaxID=3014558 RepID=UPI0022B4F6C0|nr:hypothetical protein [Streptomyces sp. ActVer]MCZ4515696.1 hypothetical protein [Streptomyces sp. ActVer]